MQGVDRQSRGVCSGFARQMRIARCLDCERLLSLAFDRFSFIRSFPRSRLDAQQPWRRQQPSPRRPRRSDRPDTPDDADEPVDDEPGADFTVVVDSPFFHAADSVYIAAAGGPPHGGGVRSGHARVGAVDHPDAGGGGGGGPWGGVDDEGPGGHE